MRGFGEKSWALQSFAHSYDFQTFYVVICIVMVNALIGFQFFLNMFFNILNNLNMQIPIEACYRIFTVKKFSNQRFTNSAAGASEIKNSIQTSCWSVNNQF